MSKEFIANTLDNAFRWVCCGNRRKPRRCNNCDPCNGLELVIVYDWAGTGMRDLDTMTSFLDESFGWSCANDGQYLAWVSSDNTSENGNEQVNVKIETAHEDGAWTSSATIGLHAGWYTPAGGSGPAEVRVTYKGVTQSKSISPGSQSSCASTSVGTVTVYDDGTFTLA